MADNIKYIRWAAFVFLLAACTPQSNEIAALPTIAVLSTTIPTSTMTLTQVPAATQYPTATYTSSPSPTFEQLPTFTLAPIITTLEAEMTAYNRDYIGIATQVAALPQSMMTALGPSTLSVEELSMFMTSAWEGVEARPYITVGFRVIEETMPFSNARSTGRSLGGRADTEHIKFLYEYYSDDLTRTTYLQRVPFTLCSFKEAGMENIQVIASIFLISESGQEQANDYFCIRAEVMQQLNCEDPSRINLDTIRSSARRCESGN